MAERITIRFRLDWREYFAAREFFRATRYNMAPEHALGGLLVVASCFWFFLDKLNLRATAGLAAGLILIFAARPMRELATYLKWRGEPFFSAENTFTFTDEGVHFVMGRVESHLDWKYYQRFLESPDGFLFIYGEEAISLFPKRAFAGADEIDAFRALAKKKIRES